MKFLGKMKRNGDGKEGALTELKKRRLRLMKGDYTLLCLYTGREKQADKTEDGYVSRELDLGRGAYL